MHACMGEVKGTVIKQLKEGNGKQKYVDWIDMQH